MKLYDFMKVSMNDWDTYDTVYDACVTVCYIDDAEDLENRNDDFVNFDKFNSEIMKKVEVIRQTDDCSLLVDWSNLIRDNMDKFRAFTEKYWSRKYRNDEDEFIYQWINEIHYYIAGYVSEDFYDILVDFVETLKA